MQSHLQREGGEMTYTGPCVVIEDRPTKMLAFALCMAAQAAIWFALGVITCWLW